MKLFYAIFILFLSFSFSSVALQPPQPGEIAELKKTGEFTRYNERAIAYGNDKFSPELIQQSIAKLADMAGLPLPQTDQQFGPQLLKDMSSFGTNNILVLLMEFPDYPHTISYSTISNMVDGVGNPANYPRESLKNYYVRSSYSNLLINSTVMPWYQMSHDRNWYTNTYGDGNLANCKMVKEILSYYDASIDYGKFDNNNNGYVDYMVVFWTGPKGPWASFLDRA